MFDLLDSSKCEDSENTRKDNPPDFQPRDEGHCGKRGCGWRPDQSNTIVAPDLWCVPGRGAFDLRVEKLLDKREQSSTEFQLLQSWTLANV